MQSLSKYIIFSSVLHDSTPRWSNHRSVRWSVRLSVRHTLLFLGFCSLCTIHPNYRQAVFSITLNFPLEFTQDGLPELGSSFKEIFLVALFEKNPKLIIFHSILHPDSRGLLENLFR